MAAPTKWHADKRLGGLARFAVAITVLNLLGHFWLGFEQPWLQPLVALAAAYGSDLLIETVAAWAQGRSPKYLGAPWSVPKFLLSAHISGLAVSMLLYSNERLWVIAFASALAICSKHLLRVPIVRLSNGKWQSLHFLNPSNLGITATLLLFPWVGIAQPYQFTENVSGSLDWILPAIIIGTGSLLNTKFTERMPLILAWATTFAAQAIVRALIHDTPVAAGLMPMTGFAFVLFSFYMVTDPATTPTKPLNQIVFGAGVALAYAFFMEQHIVFGLFYALCAVCICRGLLLYARYRYLAVSASISRIEDRVTAGV